jgi:hypothetical protein
MTDCQTCGGIADFTIFRGVERVYACGEHCREIMNTCEGQIHVTTVEEAAGIPDGTGFTRDWFAKYNDGHWFNQELAQMLLRLLHEKRDGFWMSNGLVYEGPEEKAAIMSMVFASLSSMMGKAMAVFLTAPGVTMDHPDMTAMMDKLLMGNVANAKEDAVAHSTLLERKMSGKTLQ